MFIDFMAIVMCSWW